MTRLILSSVLVVPSERDDWRAEAPRPPANRGIDAQGPCILLSKHLRLQRPQHGPVRAPPDVSKRGRARGRSPGRRRCACNPIGIPFCDPLVIGKWFGNTRFITTGYLEQRESIEIVLIPICRVWLRAHVSVVNLWSIRVSRV